jgi:hypothetical protein
VREIYQSSSLPSGKEKGREEGGVKHARIDKGTPALLALFALHPFLVERDEVRVWCSRKLGKIAK